MKKVILMATLVLISMGCFAQKSNVNKAKGKISVSENADFDGARELIKQALQDETTKDDANTWFVAAQIGYKENEYWFTQSAFGGAIDSQRKGEAVMESYDYLLKADELALTPNEKGKVNNGMHKKIKDIFLEYYTQQELVKYGLWCNDKKDYKTAYYAFDKHLAIPDLPLMQDPKYLAKMPKDTIYQQYRYYQGLFATQADMHAEAIAIFEQMKDGEYEPITINQFLYQEYVQQKDTVKYVKVLQDAVTRFPGEPWFLQNLINHYIYSGQEAAAIDYLNQAIEREPNVAQYHHIKGNLEENRGAYEEALKEFDAALALDPTLADAVAGKGRVYYNKAVKMNEEAAYIQDNKEYKKATEAYEAEFKKSLPFFEKAHQLDPDNRNYMIILKGLYYRFNMNKEYQDISEELNK